MGAMTLALTMGGLSALSSIASTSQQNRQAQYNKKMAEAQAQAIMKVQQALADAMRMLNENAPNDQVIKLKALEAFQKAADGKATKIIIPSEIQGLAGLAASAKTLLEDDKPEQNQ